MRYETELIAEGVVVSQIESLGARINEAPVSIDTHVQEPYQKAVIFMLQQTLEHFKEFPDIDMSPYVLALTAAVLEDEVSSKWLPASVYTLTMNVLYTYIQLVKEKPHSRHLALLQKMQAELMGYGDALTGLRFKLSIIASPSYQEQVPSSTLDPFDQRFTQALADLAQVPEASAELQAKLLEMSTTLKDLAGRSGSGSVGVLGILSSTAQASSSSGASGSSASSRCALQEYLDASDTCTAYADCTGYIVAGSPARCLPFTVCQPGEQIVRDATDLLNLGYFSFDRMCAQPYDVGFFIAHLGTSFTYDVPYDSPVDRILVRTRVGTCANSISDNAHSFISMDSIALHTSVYYRARMVSGQQAGFEMCSGDFVIGSGDNWVRVSVTPP